MPTSVQSVDYLAIGAPLLVAVLALLLLVLDAFLGPAHRQVTGWLAALGLVGGLALLVPLVGERRETFCVPGRGLVLPACSYVVDDLTLVFQALVLAGAVVVVLLSLDTVRLGGIPPGEYWFLLLASVSGALTLAASRDVLTLVVSLEVVSLPGLRAGRAPALRRTGQRGGAQAVPGLGGLHGRHAVRPQPRLRRHRPGAPGPDRHLAGRPRCP